MRHREKYRLLERKTKAGKIVYHVRYYDAATGKRITVSSGEETKTRARDYAETIIAGGSVRSPTLEDYTADFFKWDVCPWIKRQQAKGRSFGEYQAQVRRAHLDNHIVPQFGKKRLAELTRPMIENWLISLELANQTKNHILYTLRIILREAKAAKLIADNPLQETEPLGKNPRKRDALTMDELRLLFPTHEEKLLSIWRELEYAALFLTVATTGIRSGEVRALLWQHVLPGGWLHVERAVKMNGSIGTTKTGDQRVIALPARTVEILEQWRQKTLYKLDDDFVFPGRDGDKPLNVETLTHFFPGALKRAEIPVNGRNLVVHSLRHTYNTIMRAVLPEGVLRQFTGHRTPEMTGLYDHPTIADTVKRLEGSQAIVNGVWQ